MAPGGESSAKCLPAGGRNWYSPQPPDCGYMELPLPSATIACAVPAAVAIAHHNTIATLFQPACPAYLPLLETAHVSPVPPDTGHEPSEVPGPCEPNSVTSSKSPAW